MSWMKLAACCLYDSSLSADTAFRLLGDFVREAGGIELLVEVLQAEDDLFGRGVTSPAGVGLAAQFLRSLAVDWASVDVTDEDLDGLAELMLRLIGSLMQYPASTPRSPDDVRTYVGRWLGPALAPARGTS